MTIFISEMRFEKANQINSEIVQYAHPMLSLIHTNKYIDEVKKEGSSQSTTNKMQRFGVSLFL